MKFKIEDINELSDSRQVMEAKPHKFTSIFIYILLASILIFILWAWFSEKEIVVKVSGIIKPNEQSYVVSNMVSGEVKEVNMENGQDIKNGQVLYKIDDSNLQSQKNKLGNQKEDLTKDTKNLEKLKMSIDDNTNYFSDNEEEKEYYYKYKSYEASNKVSIEDKRNLIDSKNEVANKIGKLETLIKSINDNQNYNEEGSIYSEQFNNYRISKKSIEDKIEKLERNKEELKNQSAPKEQIDQIDSEIEANKNALVKLRSDINLQIKNSINELNEQVKNIDSNVSKFDEGVSLSEEKNKVTLLAQIEEKINLNKDKLKEVDFNIEEVNKGIEKCEVKSTVDGKLDIKANLEPGAMIQTGAIVASVLPKENNYKIELIIPDKDIANIKNGQEVKYNFTSLPYAEYGFLKGNIENISVNSQVNNETGIVYFIGEGTLETDILYSNKNEEAVIKPGMTCEARVITRSEKMLYYLLEKLNLKN